MALALAVGSLAVASSFGGVLCALQRALDKFFEVSEGYRSDVEALRDRHKHFQKEVLIDELPADDITVERSRKIDKSLTDAESKLLDLDKRLDSICALACCIWTSLKMYVLHRSLEMTLKRVTKQLDAIYKEEEVKTRLENLSKRIIPYVKNDHDYVPIEKLPSTVIAATENFDGPSVVLLNGGVGKSTFARYISRRYEKEEEKGEFVELVISVPYGDRSILDVATKYFVGLVGKSIPDKLQELAEQLTAETQSNPLALCLARKFMYTRDKEDIRTLHDAYSGLESLFQENEAKIVPGQVDATPRSLWAAMELCIKSLENEDAQIILVLMYACEGTSVSEEVLKILHQVSKKSRSLFIRARTELETRELLKPSPNTFTSKVSFKGQDKDDELSLYQERSLGSLVKLYMENNEASKKKIKSVIDSLAFDHESQSGSPSKLADPKETVDREIVTVFCALYFDPDHSDPVIKDAAASARAASKLIFSKKTTKDLLRKSAIRPIIRLLAQPLEDHKWTSHLHCARKYAVKSLSILARGDNDVKRYIIDHKGALAGLVNSLEKDDDILLNGAATALENLASTKDNSIKMDIVTHHGALAGLFKLFSEGKNSTLQERAAGALRNLSSATDLLVRMKIVKEEGALKCLGKALLQQQNILRQIAALALKNLATGKDDSVEIRKEIVGRNTVLRGLVKTFSEEDNIDLQKLAVGVLRNLAIGAEPSIVKTIASQDGALAGLVTSMSDDRNPTLQKRAAAALRNLAEVQDDTIKFQIFKEIGALEGSLKLIWGPYDTEIKNIAAEIVRFLARSPEVRDTLRASKEWTQGWA